MRSRIHHTLASAAILAMIASLTLASVTFAAETVLTAELAGTDEGDTDGTGSAMITLDPDTGEACWELTAEGIEPVTQSHIHIGAEGETGDVVVPLDVDGFEGTSEGCVSDQDAEALQAIVDDQSGYYVNLHTEDYPAGAIRGQLVGASEPPNTAVLTTDGSGFVLGALGVMLLALATATGVHNLRAAARRG